MRHVVSISGGMSSAVAAERVITRYGRNTVSLWFADTLWEDADLYRFLDEVESYLGIPIARHAEGRTPLQVAEDEHIIPNSFLAPCSKRLKIIPFTKFIAGMTKPITVHLGLDWRESHRLAAPRKAYGAIPGVKVDFPLLWTPLDYRPYAEIIESWGIRIPSLYTLGMPHNNCGGRCVRQGEKEWRRLADAYPERFREVSDWEATQRQNPKLARRAILRRRDEFFSYPKPLASLDIGTLPMLDAIAESDACYCTFGGGES